MPEKMPEKELSHPVNEALLDQASKVLEERKTLEDRLRKLEGSRNGVSATVYDRVKKDYLQKMEGVQGRFDALKKELDQELVALTEKRLLITENRQKHSEVMEEAKLRHSLGEFSTEDFDKITSSESKEIERLDSALQKLGADLTRFERLIEVPTAPKQSAPPPPPPPPRPTPPPVKEAVVSSPSIATETQKQPLPEPTSKIKLEPKKPAQLVVTEEGKATQTIVLDRTLTIGRSPSSGLVLNEPKVSRQHAQIQVFGDKYVLLDLESSNGTFVGGKKIAEYILNPGDEIRIGKTTLLFKP